MNILSKSFAVFSQRHIKIIFLFVFGGALVFPSAFMLVNYGGMVSKTEKRQLAEFPSLPSNLEEYKVYTSSISNYFRDRFGFRARLLRIYSYIKVFYLNVSPTPRAIIGKNRWLYIADWKIIDYARNLMPYQKTELEEIARELQSRKDWISSKHSRYVWMIPPNKHSIYPEYLPDYVTKVGKVSKLDQWVEYFSKHTTVPILDFRKVLIDHKNILPTYDKADSHWNPYGAYLAYRHLMDFLYKWMPDIEPVTINQNDFHIEPDVIKQDIAILMGISKMLAMTTVNSKTHQSEKCGVKYNIRSESPWKESHKRQHWWPKRNSRKKYYVCDKKKYTVLIFHDSFIFTLVPFLADTFNKTIFVRVRPNLLMLKWFVDKYNPDLVIEEMGERGMAGKRFYNKVTENELNQVDGIGIDKIKK